MKSRKRSDGPVEGPTGSYEVSSAGPAGPVCPEWLKYGPMERMTGVLASPSDLGRRMSACSVTPSEEEILACDHAAPAGTASARPAAGTTAKAPSARPAQGPMSMRGRKP